MSLDFDCVIMNPPYDGNTHLKILNNVVEEFPDAEIVNLSPIRWLQDPLSEYKKASDFKRFPKIREHIESLEVMDANLSSAEFSAQISSNLGIYYITKNGKGADLRNAIIMKMLQKGDYYDELEPNKKDGWRIRIPIIGGSCRLGIVNGLSNLPKLIYFYDGMKDGKPWHEHYRKSYQSKETEEITHSLKFASEQEAQNFIDTMHTKVGRYYFGNLMQDVHILPQYFLKLDYSKKWTDEDLYEYFNLTSDEIKEIEETVK